MLGLAIRAGADPEPEPDAEPEHWESDDLTYA
jgi:hypothetical protein